MAPAAPLSIVANDNSLASLRKPRFRFASILGLRDGVDAGLDAQCDITFEEQAFAGFAAGDDRACPALWLGEAIDRIGRLATMRDVSARPICLVAPLAALSHPDAAMCAEAGASRANMCPQEFRIEFSDAAILEEGPLGVDRLAAFYRRGFRIGIDARRGWRTPLCEDLRAIVEAVRVDQSILTDGSVSPAKFDVAISAGMTIYAENACWSDADELAVSGVNYAVAPRADG